MAMPPKFTVNSDGEVKTYFDLLLDRCHGDLDGIEIEMKGYDDLIEKARKLNLGSPNDAWEISSEANAWSEYIADLKANIYLRLQDLETDKTAEFAEASIKADASVASRGDRAANKDVAVVQARKRRNHMEALYNALQDKQDTLERLHYFCKTTCDWDLQLAEQNKKQGGK
jgi:hypothetical protein